MTGYSALDAIKLAWHLLVDEGWTCDRICEKFDTIGIPTYSVTNGDPSREWHASPLPGPAKWQDNALRRLLRSSFYAGTLTYRAKDGTLHSHPVPAIFTAEQVEQARDALRRHRRFSHTPQKHAYLLDDLLRCTECGALYTTHWSEHHPTGPHKGERWRYYICATRRYRTDRARLARVAAGELHADCRAPSVDALYAEQQIWADIEYFIRHPAETLALLAAKRSATSEQQDEQRAQLTRMQQALDKLQGERDTVMREYRKERIDDRTKDRQLDEIAEEEAGHIKTRQSLLAALQDTSDEQSRLETARTLLQQLHARLDAGPPTPAVKYDIVHALVREIRVDIKELGLSQRGRLKRRAVLNVTYRFDPPETRALPAAAGDQLCSDQRSPARSSPHN